MTSWLRQQFDPAAEWHTWGRYAFPAAASNVRQWFVRSLLAPHGGRERLARSLVGRVPYPLAEAIAGPKARADRRSTAELGLGPGRMARILNTAEVAALLRQRSRSWQVLVEFSEQAVTRSRMIAFLFRHGEPRPDLLVRVGWRKDEGEHGGARDRVERLRGNLPQNLASTLPSLLTRVAEADCIAEISAAFPGRSGYSLLLASARPRSVCERLLERGLDWLGRFHQATMVALTEEGPALCAAGHGDFWIRNVLFEGNRVSAVLDWEQSSPEEQVNRDLTTFLLSVAEAFQRRVGKHDTVEAFRRSFTRAGWFRDCAEEGVAGYCDRIGQSLPALDVLLRTEVERRLAGAVAPGTEENLQRCLCLLK